MWNIYCESAIYCRVNNAKDMKLFSDQMNRNRPDPILARCDWSCSAMDTLRCLNSGVNEIV